MPTIGLRREDKHHWEARVPLVPDAVARLVAEGLNVVVQPSEIRAFADEAYRRAGAAVAQDLAPADVVFAVKEIPLERLRRGGAYVFFSHTIKGQPHNMPLLRRMMDLGCTLIDYERIVDERGRRLVFFGRHAGLAGMLDTLALLGRRHPETPFAALRLAHEYADLDAAKRAVRALRGAALPGALQPFVVGFTGYGNVSRGAQEIYDLLEPSSVDPDALSGLRGPGPYKVVFEERHLVRRAGDGGFELQEYFDHPERYRSIFERHAPHLSVLVNAIYWTEAYPRLLTKPYLERAGLRLLAVGDISCDLDGSVESTVKATTPGEPSYVYDPRSGTVRDGVEGEGILMMTTDCLPCELPREASQAFTDALLPFVADLARADLDGGFDAAGLPQPIRAATVLWRGELTPDYRFLQRHVTRPGTVT